MEERIARLQRRVLLLTCLLIAVLLLAVAGVGLHFFRSATVPRIETGIVELQDFDGIAVGKQGVDPSNRWAGSRRAHIRFTDPWEVVPRIVVNDSNTGGWCVVKAQAVTKEGFDIVSLHEGGARALQNYEPHVMWVAVE